MMKKLAVRLFSALSFLALIGGLAFVAFPGWHRVLLPTLSGVERVSPRLYTDAPEQADRFQAMISRAEQATSAFFKDPATQPVFIVCTTDPCAKAFGVSFGGLNFASHVNLIGPRGLTQTIFTHEQTHSDLHRGQVLRLLWDPAFPQWFDEGLASYVARETTLPRVRRPNWVLPARRWYEWRRLRKYHHWKRMYGSAQSLIRSFVARHGEDALRDLIAQVRAGERFDDLWNAAMPEARIP